MWLQPELVVIDEEKYFTPEFTGTIAYVVGVLLEKTNRISSLRVPLQQEFLLL